MCSSSVKHGFKIKATLSSLKFEESLYSISGLHSLLYITVQSENHI